MKKGESEKCRKMLTLCEKAHKIALEYNIYKVFEEQTIVEIIEDDT